jgi:hypothetical protein
MTQERLDRLLAVDLVVRWLTDKSRTMQDESWLVDALPGPSPIRRYLWDKLSGIGLPAIHVDIDDDRIMIDGVSFVTPGWVRYYESEADPYSPAWCNPRLASYQVKRFWKIWEELEAL